MLVKQHLFVFIKVCIATMGRTMLAFGTLCTFLITFHVCFLVDFLLAVLKLLLNLRFAGFGAEVPRVLLDTIHIDALGRVEFRHLLKEILELITVDRSSFFNFIMGFPEKISSVSSQKAVMRIIRLWAIKWWSL